MPREFKIMPNDSNNSTYNLGAAPPAALTIQRHDERDEAAFLRRQAEEAKQAMQQTFAEMRETAKTAADVQAWTQAHPWPSVGAGVLAGFMASGLLPSRKTTDQPSSKSPLLSFVQTSLFGAIRSVAISAVTNAILAQPEEPEPNGAPESLS